MTHETPKPAWVAALGKVPSGLFIVTTADTGFLASWVQQCSFDPPQLSIAIAKGRPVLEALGVGTAVGVNVIPEGGKSLVAHFGRGFAPGEPAFDGIDVETHEESSPCLLAALAWIDTRVVSLIDAGDHMLVVARIVDGRVLGDHKPTVHTRRDGTRY